MRYVVKIMRNLAESFINTGESAQSHAVFVFRTVVASLAMFVVRTLADSDYL